MRLRLRRLASGADGLRHFTPISVAYLFADLRMDVAAGTTVPSIRLLPVRQQVLQTIFMGRRFYSLAFGCGIAR